MKTRKFDEAVELQDKIVELLREALAEARNAGLETSIRAQIDFHLKQKEVIRVKAARWEEFCLAVAALQVRMNVSGDGSADAEATTIDDDAVRIMKDMVRNPFEDDTAIRSERDITPADT